MNIYSVLKTKPHNSHYLKRYIKFIYYCSESNKSLPDLEYTETHHICPKAKDLFPEYTDLKVYSWNSIRLTFRQHLMAHVMLWKTFKGSQAMALECMLGSFNANTNDLLANRKIPTKYAIFQLQTLKFDANKRRSEVQKGFATYKDEFGNRYFLHKEDTKIKELSLIGVASGYKRSNESKAKSSKSKAKFKKITLYFLDIKIKVKLYSEELSEYLSQGWNTYCSEEDKKYCKQSANNKRRNKLKEKANYALPDGTYYGKLSKNSPEIEKLGLIFYITENHKKQAKISLKLGSICNTGTKCYNDGTKTIKRKKHPGEGWEESELLFTQTNKSCGLKKYTSSINGYSSWNDGVKNYRVLSGDIPQSHWVKGLLRSDAIPISDLNKIKELYNSGTTQIKELMLHFNNKYSNYKIKTVLGI